MFCRPYSDFASCAWHYTQKRSAWGMREGTHETEAERGHTVNINHENFQLIAFTEGALRILLSIISCNKRRMQSVFIQDLLSNFQIVYARGLQNRYLTSISVCLSLVVVSSRAARMNLSAKGSSSWSAGSATRLKSLNKEWRDRRTT